MNKLLFFLALFFVATVSAQEERKVRVLASIPPIHSIVSAVLEGVAEPEIIFYGSRSPHHQNLSPSILSKISQSDVLVWISPEFETSVRKVVAEKFTDENLISLEQAGGLTLYKGRDFGLDGHDVHQEEEHGHGDSHEAGYDLHIWLSHHNAEKMAAFIAKKMSLIYPEYSSTYQANYIKFRNKLRRHYEKLKLKIDPVSSVQFVFFHDAFQYFEKSFGLRSIGTVIANPEVSNSFSHEVSLRKRIKKHNAKCLFLEPQLQTSAAEVLVKDTGINIATLDVLGKGLPLDSNLWFSVMDNITDNLVGCLSKD